MASSYALIASITNLPTPYSRDVQDPESYNMPQSAERVLISAQALKDAYGADSQQYKGACCLLQQLISSSIHTLQKAHHGR